GQIAPIQPTDSTYISPDKPDPSWASWGTSLQGTKFNNLGISGIRLTDCVALSLSEKGFNQIVCSNNPDGRYMNFGSLASPIQYIDNIRSSHATFFTNWLGSNDVLGYATSGGVLTVLFGDTLNGITPPSVFKTKYDSILVAFHNMGAKGVCVTIPNVTSIPYFNTVPTYVVVDGVRKYFYITTASGVRQATDKDYILLTAYDSVQSGWGSSIAKPLNNDLVLDSSEAAAVESATLQYNSAIYSLAAKYGYGVVDMYTFLERFQSSYTIDGVSFARTFIQGGTFGLDGIHPNARGYAVVANQIISAINSTYGSTLPQADITKYKAVIFPNF
ncbi:MAG TPA: SGNH/GDSL hydrolase family protein, partial [Bacteroidia bacterium]|nr:SGNH/GDSL hydrolase family protein [Bacteroidia bacterium]